MELVDWLIDVAVLRINLSSATTAFKYRLSDMQSAQDTVSKHPPLRKLDMSATLQCTCTAVFRTNDDLEGHIAEEEVSILQSLQVPELKRRSP